MSYKSCLTWQLCLSGSCASRTVQFLRMLGINRARIVRVFTCRNAVTGYAIAMPTAPVMPISCLRLVEQDAKAEKLDLGLLPWILSSRCAMISADCRGILVVDYLIAFRIISWFRIVNDKRWHVPDNPLSCGACVICVSRLYFSKAAGKSLLNALTN